MGHSRAIRALTVLDSLAVGGTETHALSLMKSLARRGVRPVYAGSGGPMYGAFARAGCPIVPVDLTPWTLMQEGAVDDASRRLARIMRHRRVDIVHAHQTPSGLAALRAARSLGIPAVFTVHGAYYPPEQLREIAEGSQAIVSVSKPVEAALEGMGIASELVPNGVDSTEFRPGPPDEALRRSLGIPEDAATIVYASRLAWDKAVVCAMLIMAVRRLRESGRRNLQLIIVGDGNQYSEVRELAESTQRRAGASFIHLVGSRPNMADYYVLGDLVVGTGRVALEAMACGRPVLAIGNHGFFGLVEPVVYEQAWALYFGDHASLQPASETLIAETLDRLLSDRERLDTAGREGRRWVAEHFDSGRLGERMLELYCRVMGTERQHGRKGGRT